MTPVTGIRLRDAIIGWEKDAGKISDLFLSGTVGTFSSLLVTFFPGLFRGLLLRRYLPPGAGDPMVMSRNTANTKE